MSDNSAQKAQLLEQQRAARASGGASRILTGGMGDTTPAPTAGAMLTGN